MVSHLFWYYTSGYAIAVCACVLLSRHYYKWLSARPPYPPGPKGLPLIGNVYDIPSINGWETYARWSRQYDSDLIHLKLPGAHLIVVNSANAAFELFEKRSAIYSDRPRFPMLTELIRWDLLTLYRYGPRWRAARRMFYKYFNPNAITKFQPQQARAAHELLYRLAHTPEEFKDHTNLMVGSHILNITYGMNVNSTDDPYMQLVEGTMKEALDTLNPSAYLVNTLPILKYVPEWFPGAGFKTRAKELQKLTTESIDKPFQYAKDNIAKGIYTPSIVSMALEEHEGNEDAESLARTVTGVTYAAGVESTTSTLLTFILAMVLHPEVARKAQEELDRVVGPDRLPDWSDKPSLPYACAIVKEIIRCFPAAPLAIVHRLTEDDVYEGMYLPAGSLVLGNSWAMIKDEKDYPEPDKFNPDRFMKDGELDPDIRDPETMVFGFGRRMCPGRHLALQSIFLNVASILATFNIERAVDNKGMPITPKLEFEGVMFCRLPPFQCSMKPRSQRAYNIIADAYAAHHP